MEWRTLTKAEAAKITGQWIQMSSEEFQRIVTSWPETIPAGLDDDYRQLRTEVINAWDMVKDRVSASEEYRKKQDYYSDLFFARELYSVLKSRNFSIRMASNDQVWIYMCVIVFPDLVHSRYPGAVKKSADGTAEKINVNEERFWKTRRRIYLKVLWWYIYLSVQTDDNGNEDLDRTVDILKDNSTDEIVQIVERSGTAGYRVDLYRAMMKYYSLHRDIYDNKKFRQVMVLNTARSQIIEPSLMDGGVQTYVRELLNILDKKKLPEVIDLFSGCGGLALGFQSNGFRITHGIELMPEATETASYNLHWRYGEESSHICGDITKMDVSDLVPSIGENGCIVIGGPPCQAYSLVGRAKLRSLGNNRINTKDKRGYLYQDFLRYALGLGARAVVMENVPEATDFGDLNIPERVCGLLKNNGYNAFWTILNAADYGVPQLRERVFVIAVKNDEPGTFELPVPEYSSPNDFRTQNQQRFGSFEKDYRYFRRPVPADPSLPDWITVEDAFSDLPELFPTAQTRYVLNKITAPFPYRSEPQNEYQHLMREWYGTDPGVVTGNCFRRTIRDYPIFAQMKQGDGYVEASAIADELFSKACDAQGISISSNPEQYERLKKQIVPPYDRNNFKSKWQKLRLDAPSHTLVAHLSVDTYSHIHPVEPRGISVREAARLQSFPDGFLFQCAMGDAFKQIGNAVPPLLAGAIAHQIRNVFSEET